MISESVRTKIGVGWSQKTDLSVAGEEAARMALAQTGGAKPDLAIVFSTTHYARPELFEGIAKVIEGTRIVGSTGAGIITQDGFKNFGVSVMLICSLKMKFGLGFAKNIGEKPLEESGEEFARIALTSFGHQQRLASVIFLDGLIENEAPITEGIKSILGTSFPLLGGLSADNFQFEKTFQYFNGDIFSKGLSGFIFGGQDAAYGIGLKHGWVPLGEPHQITRSKNNVIFEIQDQPAIRVYEEYFSKTADALSLSLPQMSLFYPLGVYMPGEGEYLLRNTIRVGPDGSLIFQGEVPQDSEVRIMLGTKESALAAAETATRQAKTASKNADLCGAIIFESISRLKLLGRTSLDEITSVKKILGQDVPLMGLATFGEQAPLTATSYKGQSYFHNESFTILTIGEHGGA